MLTFLTPAEVSRSLTRRTLPDDRSSGEWLHGPMTSVDAPVADLVAALPDGVVVTDADGMEKYRFDWSRDQSAGTPAAVVRAESAEHVQAAVRWAAEHGVSVVPRGAGSGLSGGSTAVAGCLVLSLERMNTVEIDPACQVAIAQPGAFNADVKRAAGEHGSGTRPTLVLRDLLDRRQRGDQRGRAVLREVRRHDRLRPRPRRRARRRHPHHARRQAHQGRRRVALLKLFVGSEGTLGIVTRAILRLVPAQSAKSTLVASFASVRQAADAVVGMRAVMRPSMLELMDRPSINAVEDYKPMGLDREAGALLIAQSDAPGAARSEEMAVMQAACESQGAEVFVTDDADEGELFVQARRASFPALERRGSLLLEDVGAPVPLLPDLLDAIAAIADRHGVEIPVVAHAGDGNTHPNIVYDAADPDSERRARLAFDEVMAAAIALGGTITGEHGIGRAKRVALPAQLGPDVMALTQRIKDALDPQGILNPGAGF